MQWAHSELRSCIWTRNNGCLYILKTVCYIYMPWQKIKILNYYLIQHILQLHSNKTVVYYCLLCLSGYRLHTIRTLKHNVLHNISYSRPLQHNTTDEYKTTILHALVSILWTVALSCRQQHSYIFLQMCSTLDLWQVFVHSVPLFSR